MKKCLFDFLFVFWSICVLGYLSPCMLASCGVLVGCSRLWGDIKQLSPTELGPGTARLHGNASQTSGLPWQPHVTFLLLIFWSLCGGLSQHVASKQERFLYSRGIGGRSLNTIVN